MSSAAVPPSVDPAAERRRDRIGVVALTVAACVGAHVAYVMQSVPLRSANDRSRWATVRALSEENTYIIDRAQRDKTWATIDLVRHEGHFYSTKPPLLPTILGHVVDGITATLGWTLSTRPIDTTRLVLLLVNALPMAVALALLGGIAVNTTRTTFAPVVAVLAAGVGTMHLPFVATLNNHTIGLWAAAFALAATLRIEVAACRRQQRLAAVLAGLFGMWCCCNELPAALFGLTLFGWLAWRDWRLACFWFLPAALVPLLFFFWTNYAATGGWKPFYMYYGTEKYEFYYDDGRPSYWMNPQGIDRNLDSPGMYALHCLVGHHGLFSLTPVLLVAVAGCFGLPRFRDRFPDRFPDLDPATGQPLHARWLQFWAIAAAVLSVAVLGFFLTRTENYNYGGNSVALRWMLWLTPLWSVLMIVACDRFRSTAFRAFVVVALAASVFSAVEPGPNPWQANWLFDALTQANLISY